MLGPIGANLMSILRVLSPSEIDLYSEVNDKITRPIAVGAENIHYDEHNQSTAQNFQTKTKKSTSEDAEPEDDTVHTKAKIIPINQQAKDHLESNKSVELSVPKNLSGNPEMISGSEKNSLNALGILSASQMKQQVESEQREKNKQKESTSVFILNQREKLKQSRLKMVEQRAIKQYKENSVLEFVTREIVDEDLENQPEQETRDSTSKGILVNKKHY